MNRAESQECTYRGAEISKAAITGRFNCFDFAGERPRRNEEEPSYFVEVLKYSHAIPALQSYLNENRNKSLSLSRWETTKWRGTDRRGRIIKLA